LVRPPITAAAVSFPRPPIFAAPPDYFGCGKGFNGGIMRPRPEAAAIMFN
jgi:hypothetical protein